MKIPVFILWFVASCTALFGQEGIVVAVNNAYAEGYFLPSLFHLRRNLGCDLPIEVWFVGDELSQEWKEKLARFPPIAFRNLADYVTDDPSQYKGWQIKAWLLKFSPFEDTILMDADVYFFQNPKILFSHPEYKRRGCYLFRDRSIYRYPVNPFLCGIDEDVACNLEAYLRRRAFFRSLIALPSDSLPEEWSIYWREELPTVESTYTSEHVDSGCVAIHKPTHLEAIEAILQLNKNRKVVYTYVHGDKETYWLGCEIAGQPYAVNPLVPCALVDRYVSSPEMYQFLDGALFFQQKNPILVSEEAFFVPHQVGGEKERRQITWAEFWMVQKAYFAKREAG